jgi:hypothetical protein
MIQSNGEASRDLIWSLFLLTSLSIDILNAVQVKVSPKSEQFPVRGSDLDEIRGKRGAFLSRDVNRKY